MHVDQSGRICRAKNAGHGRFFFQCEHQRRISTYTRAIGHAPFGTGIFLLGVWTEGHPSRTAFDRSGARYKKNWLFMGTGILASQTGMVR